MAWTIPTSTDQAQDFLKFLTSKPATMQTKTQLLFGVAFAVCASLGGAQQVEVNSCPDVTPLSSLDHARYRGIWYEQYRLFETTEAGASCVEQDLETVSDGAMILTQTQYVGSSPMTVKFDMNFPDPDEPAKFELTPERPLVLPGVLSILNAMLPPVQMMVVDTDYTTYAVAYRCLNVIGMRREGLYIYSRDRAGLDEATVTRLAQNLLDMGVSLATLTKSDQETCPPQ